MILKIVFKKGCKHAQSCRVIKTQLHFNVKCKPMSPSSDKQISRQKLKAFFGLHSFIIFDQKPLPPNKKMHDHAMQNLYMYINKPRNQSEMPTCSSISINFTAMS